jgi:hypothetical protein
LAKRLRGRNILTSARGKPHRLAPKRSSGDLASESALTPNLAKNML